ncbi:MULTISPECIES: hypothetical protein [unclassified Microbacterium]|uniref:hypothetical protein n=1 Tax=unclassified Microbacterium TaxID=2609290 RepID=UPI001AC72B54|nr:MULTISPECIES: hypothetical protein [unclassified Microbacterium]MBN9224460.1 hypothetical protein [Microbacterium sp.]
MSRPPRPLPPGLGEAFRVADALALGVTPTRLRSATLEAPFRGIRTAPFIADDVDEDAPFAHDRRVRERTLHVARAYAPLLPPSGFFAGRTAAVLWGLYTPPSDGIEVAVFAGTRAPRRVGVRARTVLPALATVRLHEGLRVASPATTWAMLGAESDVRALVVAGDAAVRIPRDRWGILRPDAALATVAELQAAVDAGRRAGAARLRAALASIVTGAASPPETLHRLDCAAAGLPTPLLDAEIRDGTGRLLGVSEFAYPSARLVVELEGDHHRTSARQWHRDIEKYRAYAEAGWEVVRITAADRRTGRDVEVVRRALARRGGL